MPVIKPANTEILIEILSHFFGIKSIYLNKFYVSKFQRHVFKPNSFEVRFKNKDLQITFDYLNEFAVSRKIKTPEELKGRLKKFNSRFSTFFLNSITSDVLDRIDLETSYKANLESRKAKPSESADFESFIVATNTEILLRKMERREKTASLTKYKEENNSDGKSIEPESSSVGEKPATASEKAESGTSATSYSSFGRRRFKKGKAANSANQRAARRGYSKSATGNTSKANRHF